METITELHPELVTSPSSHLYSLSLHPSFSPLSALNREQRERGMDRNANVALVGIQLLPQDIFWTVMLNAAPSFLNVFHRLMASIMQEGRQRADADTGQDSDVYLRCSRLIERMYSHIAATAESFTTLSAFMVAQYVTELQKVTLRPDIKLHLTEGIYQILDLCMEQDIKFLTAGLQMGVREVFNELYGSYTHYHKAQRQGEDKYTV